MEKSKDSPLMFVEINDVIVETQKKKITNSKQFANLVEEIINKGEKTLYLAIYNSSNQRSYITIKLNKFYTPTLNEAKKKSNFISRAYCFRQI